MKYSIAIFLFLVTLLFSCKSNKAQIVEVPEPLALSAEESCVCPHNYAPVCGCDNKTYPNACHAQCSNVTFVEGKCKDKK